MESKLWWGWITGDEIEPTLNTLSISFLSVFRDISGNELTELPAGIFDSLASLTTLYVLSLVAETPFVSSVLDPDISSSSFALT